MKRAFLLLLCCAFLLVGCAQAPVSDEQEADEGQNINDSSDQTSQDGTTSETNPTDDETNDVPPIVDSGEPHAHTYKETVISPTCDKDGFTSYSCECGDQYTSDTIIAKGHSYNDWVEKVAPTETSVGKEERKCKNCEETETRNIPKLIAGHTHSYTSFVSKEATCQSEGIKTFSCSCGAEYKETIGAKPHNYKTKVVKPTCTERGYTTHTCSCGAFYVSDYTYFAPHSYSEKVTEATCAQDGYIIYTCSCGYLYTKRIAATGKHTWGSWETVTAAQVGKAGQEKRTCSTCKKTETREIPALQEDLTQKWFVAQYNLAKQQYIYSLEQSKSSKQDEITELKADIDYELDKYTDKRIEILSKYPPSATRDVMLTNAQQNYAAAVKPYKDKVSRLESEIATIDAEIENPNVDKILTIVTQNCNISSQKTYEYYNKYSSSIT